MPSGKDGAEGDKVDDACEAKIFDGVTKAVVQLQLEAINVTAKVPFIVMNICFCFAILFAILGQAMVDQSDG